MTVWKGLGKYSFLLAIGAVLMLESCGRDEVTAPETSDAPAPPELVHNNIQPTAGPFVTQATGALVEFPLIGLLDPVDEGLVDFVPYESVWVVEDGKSTRFTIRDIDQGEPAPIDMVFVVDNSGSMDSEADRIAEGMTAYATALADLGWDIRFGCVGQNGSINGGIGLTDTEGFLAYLTRPNRYGTSRTVGFEEPSGPELSAWETQRGSRGGGENGVEGIRCAEEVMSWRDTAVRIFLNFTDEPIQSPSGQDEWDPSGYCAGWTADRGAVHTIWSGGQSLDRIEWSLNRKDNPADLSTCTGGTVLEIAPDASDLDLSTIPLVALLDGAVMVSFESSDTSAEHDLEIVVQNGSTSDGALKMRSVRYR